MSRSIDSLLRRVTPKVSDVVGIDVGASGIKTVRMQKSRDAIVLAAADILPPLHSEAGASGEAPELATSLSPRLKARHACLTVPGENAVVKLLSFPGQVETTIESKLTESLGLKHLNRHRIGYEITTEGQARSESRVLAVALPEEDAAAAISLLPAGIPVPYSLEISGLATLTAFMHGYDSPPTSDAVGLIEFGASTSSFALFNRGHLALVRRFQFGTHHLVAGLSETLGLDRQTATDIIANNSFDISQPIHDAIDPIVKQLVVSRDFVERRENCHVAALYVCGGVTLSQAAVEQINLAMGIEVRTWSPLANVKVLDDAIPPEIAGQEWRLAAAIGACLASFEKS